MEISKDKKLKVKTGSVTITPWLSIQGNKKAVEFYKTAFNAVETYRFETPDGGLILKLSIEGAEFWVSIEGAGNKSSNRQTLGGNSVRMILTVDNPEKVFEQAVKAGAVEVFPVGISHGWKLGRLADPLGLHWEIGHPLNGE